MSPTPSCWFSSFQVLRSVGWHGRKKRGFFPALSRETDEEILYFYYRSSLQKQPPPMREIKSFLSSLSLFQRQPSRKQARFTREFWYGILSFSYYSSLRLERVFKGSLSDISSCHLFHFSSNITDINKCLYRKCPQKTDFFLFGIILPHSSLLRKAPFFSKVSPSSVTLTLASALSPG